MMAKRSALRARTELRRSVDQDGVVKVELKQSGWERWIWILGLAAMVVLGATALRTWTWVGAPPASEGHRGKGNEEAPGARASGGSRSPREPVTRVAARPNEAAAPAPHASISDPEAPFAPDGQEEQDGTEGGQEQAGQEQAGQERAGIRLFPAPGTKPIKRGIVVPDDFPLPPGYVRHFQATDKGQMLQAILMFHPDYDPLDAHGNPVPVPPDRIVPPELAPSGLPVELLEVPQDAYADREEAGADTAP